VKFEELPINQKVLEGIKAAGFTECTPVQALTLPEALKGRDIAAQAQTGTGKTAAFLIAVFSRMLEVTSPGRGLSPRALIIAPTRELVIQINAEARILGGPAGFRILPVFGGIDYLKQRQEISKGVDVLIGTPGRLIDYLKQKVYSLRKTQFLVIDEADRMFDMGFISDLRFLLRRMSPYDKRQSMLFSATLSYRVMELAYEHMNLPEKISITPEKITVEQVEQVLYHVGKHEKMPLLLGILRQERPLRTLIFVNTRRAADMVVERLNRNAWRALAITGDIEQKKRLRILADFKEGKLPILVATDVASRGIHVEGVTHVVNFDLPQDVEDYVHRIGRTGRAGATGRAISLADEEYVYSLEGIEKYIGQKIPVQWADESMYVREIRRPAEEALKSNRPRPSAATSPKQRRFHSRARR